MARSAVSEQKSGKELRKSRSALLAVLIATCALLAVTAIVLVGVIAFMAGSQRAPEGTPDNTDQGQSVSDIADLGREYTVAIQTRIVTSQGTVSVGVGTGIILTENGYIATNSHVVSGAESITVYTYEGKTYGGKVIEDDPSHDIALIRINPDNSSEKFKTAKIGDYDKVKVGDRVVAIGTPHSIDYAWTTSVGYVSYLGRKMSISNGAEVAMIQTDTPVNPGNSGGPLINSAGEVIGIVSAKLDMDYEGINFAIPISEYMKFFNNGIDEDMEKPQLGVTGTSVSDDSYYLIRDRGATRVFDDNDGKGYYMKDTIGQRYYLSEEEYEQVVYVKKSGFMILGITENSDANGKLQIYDVITEFDGVELIYDNDNIPYDTVVDILARKKAADKVSVKYVRDGNEKETVLSLKEKD